MDDIAKRDWLTKEEAKAFIGKNSSFYLEKWKANPDSAYKGWNWAAMFFSIEWMVYRKMYIEALLYFLILLALSTVIGLMLETVGVGFDGRLARDAFRILAGFFGNALYRKKALRTLRKTNDMSDLGRISFLNYKGGVSVVAVFVCIAIECVIAYLSIVFL